MGPIRRVALIIAVVVIPACHQSPPTPPAPAPGNPTTLSAGAITCTEIDLLWNNGVLPQTSVTVERSIDNVSFASIGSTTGTATTYKDQIVLPTSTYYYRVRAFNEDTPSPLYSNVAQATTPTPAWSQISTGAPPPTARVNIGAANALVSDQMIVCAGDDISNPPANTETWALKYSGTGSPSWTQQGTGTNPGVRSSPSVVYDAVNQRIVLFGGVDQHDLSNPVFKNDVWILSPTMNPGPPPTVTWSWALLGLFAGNAPSPRFGQAAVMSGSKLYIIGGQTDFSPTSNLNDVLSLDFSSPTPVWSTLFSSGPMTPRSFHSAVLDPVGNRIIVFGGFDGTNYRNDTWSLNLGGTPFWSFIPSTTIPPAGRSNHTAVYHSSANLMIVFGGNTPGSSLNDTWILPLYGTPAWTRLVVTGSPPGQREGHASIFDDGTGRMIVFGGQDFFGTGFYFDTWQLQF